MWLLIGIVRQFLVKSLPYRISTKSEERFMEYMDKSIDTLM
jgi:hypothetical protein